MAVLSLSTIAEIYKRIFPDGITDQVVKKSPTLGLMQKKTQIFKGHAGSGKELDWRISNGTGASGDYHTAFLQAGVPTHKKPFITRGRLFAARKLDIESLKASQGNNGALVSLVREATRSATEEIQHRASSILLTGPYGSIGRISSGSVVGSATVTLSDTTQAINFKRGQRLCAIDPATNTLRSAGAVVTLTDGGVNRQTGQLTATGNWSAAIGAIAAGDYLIPEGDHGVVPVSVEEWNPETMPTLGADSFFGVDRGGSVEMAGCRHVATAGAADEVILYAAGLHQSLGGEHDTCIINSLDYNELNLNAAGLQRINTNAIGTNGKPIANIAFQGIVLNGPAGPINVFPDPYQKRRRARLLNMADLEMWSLGEPFEWQRDGMPSDGSMRIEGYDQTYMVFGGYWQIVLTKPLNSMNITLPA